MKKLNKDNLIDLYVTGKLEDAELWEFKHEMETDQDLAKEVTFRTAVYQSIADKKKIALRENIMALKSDKQPVHRFIHSWKWQVAAASVVVFLMVGAGLLTNMFHADTHSDVFSTYYHPESSLLSVRSGSMSDNTSLNLGMLSYDQGQYDESIEIFKSIPDNVVARLYCGFAYMNVKNYKAAIEEFNHVMAHGDNLFTDQAEWNIGLSYVADNKINQAKVIFNRIASQDGAYRDKATEILKDLESK